MKFKLEFNMDNDAFYGLEFRGEICRILNRISLQLTNPNMTESKIRDTNGNTIGRWEIVKEDNQV